MEAQLRTMSARDYAEVRALWERSPGIGLNESDSGEAVAAFLDRNPGMSFVAVEGGAIVGAVLCGHDGRRGYLHHLAVEKSHQGRGIGRDLVERCTQRLVALGIQKCNVFLFGDNHAGASFWRHQSFAPRADLEVYQRLLLIPDPEEVLRFWFPEDLRPGDPEAMGRQLEWWFRGGADAVISDRFAALADLAARDGLDAWAARPRSRLALILVLDQFSRSLYRDTPSAFAQDPKALALALEGIEIGHYAALATPWEKTFFAMPLGHSEDLAHLDRVVVLCEDLAAQAPPAERRLLEHSASQARAHRDVIARFGRHPHRNAILGRESTPEELEYLASVTPVHQRPLPR